MPFADGQELQCLKPTFNPFLFNNIAGIQTVRGNRQDATILAFWKNSKKLRSDSSKFQAN